MATHSRGIKRFHRLAAVLLLSLATGWGTAPRPLAAVEPFKEYDLAMFERPKFVYPEEAARVFRSGLLELWMKALDRPDAELQRMIIDTIGIAQRKGLDGLSVTKPRILELLTAPDQDQDVLRASAQTLIELDSRDLAETLAKLSLEHGAAIGQIVEPALARWQSPVMEDIWLKRVTDANSSQTMMTMAINGLGLLKKEESIEPITKLLNNTGESLSLRSSAAKVLGQFHTEGLNDIAERLMEIPSRPAELHPILAIELLSQHDDSRSIEFLSDLLDNDSTVVQSNALERLYEIDYRLVDKHAEELISSVDANVRRWVAKAMIDSEDVGRIELLCQLLDDVNPTLRRDVSAGLIELAKIDKLHDEVIDRSMEVLDQDAWRGCEQAAVVLTRLDHKPSGKRMVELLGHQRGDVQVAAAWGLSKLRMEEHLADMLDHAQSVYDGFKSRQLNDSMRGASLHVAHLFIAFGDQKYMPADALLRKYLPKDFTMGMEARPAAAWALGWLYEDNPQEDLAKALLGRLNDTGNMNPEDDDVRWMCAISLGRMKAESALPSLRNHASPLPSGMACHWAIEQMTGEKPPKLVSKPGSVDDWFLMPIRDPDSFDKPDSP